MASIGIKYYGIFKQVPSNHEVIRGQIYESRGSFNKTIPEDIALSFLKDWRDELQVKHGIISNYMEVRGTNFTVQWKVTGTPEPGIISTIAAIIIAVAVTAAAAYAVLSALQAVIKETGQVLSVLGPENVSMLTNVLFLFAFLMMFGPLISTLAELPKRIMPKGE